MAENGTNRTLRLRQRPEGRIDDSTFELVEESVPEIGAGEALIRTPLKELGEQLDLASQRRGSERDRDGNKTDAGETAGVCHGVSPEISLCMRVTVSGYLVLASGSACDPGGRMLR